MWLNHLNSFRYYVLTVLVHCRMQSKTIFRWSKMVLPICNWIRVPSWILHLVSRATLALQSDAAARHKNDLIGWFCTVDYHVHHRDFISRHQTGTGQWFLKNTKLQEWNRSKDATLLCLGLPGAGKTIVTALVIDHLLRTRHVAYHPAVFVYCSYKRQSE
jgi:hypothetical protein